MCKKILRSIFFNIFEIYLIGILGYWLDIPLNFRIMILLLFFISRFCFKQPMHYRKWYMCAVWSSSLFTTLFVLFRADIYVSILATVFCAFVTSGKGNIEDTFMFKKRSDTKYKLLDQFIMYNYDDKRLAKYERYLSENDTLSYNVYILRFKQNKKHDEIKETLDIDSKKLVSILDRIYDTLKYNLMLESE